MVAGIAGIWGVRVRKWEAVGLQNAKKTQGITRVGRLEDGGPGSDYMRLQCIKYALTGAYTYIQRIA